MRQFAAMMMLVVIMGLMMPTIAPAAGEKAANLVVVADTRVLTDSGYYGSFMKYMADAYNSNITVFAVWCTVLTACYGAFLGFLMDYLMSKTGLDLKSRKIIEH
ncbi:DVU0150 family protein [Desulfococcus sp.]|uniref:DVU0150 family protein n=1 Tax=Desulfococcus sp. TaxID=2025834 RepID=UPI003594313F